MNFEIYEKLPFDKYRQLPGLHSTGLKHALVSPLLYQHVETFGWPDSDTFRQGRAGHTANRAPARFLSDYAQWETQHEDGRKRPRNGGAWDEFREVNAGKTILTDKQYETACTLRDIVRDHPVAGPLVRGPGRNELTLKWTHGRTGAACKNRLDRVTPNEIVEVKLTRDPSPRAFGNTAARLFYHAQCAFYRDGGEACDLGRLPFKIVAVQSVAPYDVVVYDVGEDILGQGQEQYERAIDIVQECRKKQSWPGQATERALSLFLPAWATPGEDELTMDGESIF
jgi:hypothetical protein